MVKCLVFVGSIFNNLAKNRKYRQSFQFWTKIESIVKLSNFGKNRKYRQTFQFWRKIESQNFLVRFSILVKIFNCGEIFQFWWETSIFVKIVQLGSTSSILVKIFNVGQIFNLVVKFFNFGLQFRLKKFDKIF